MLRLVALALLLANLLYFTWTLGWLDAVVGVPARGDREPQRMQRQLNPEIVQLTPVDAGAAAGTVTAAMPPPAAPAASEVVAAASKPASAAPALQVAAAASTPPSASAAATKAASAAARASAPAPAPALAQASAPSPASAPAKAEAAASAVPAVKLACVEAGPFDATALAAAETALRSASLPPASWAQRRVSGNGEWMIYMGPYPDDAWIERKKAELSRIRGGLDYNVVGPTSQYGRGISLGRFGSQAEADKRLDELRPRGIRTARVIQSGEGPAKTALRFAKADPALLERLAAVQWPEGQNGLTPCAATR
ncbi:hypothetical protein [Piscinibacter sakaiensis]|uniref:hypothetical protein n=1 Tax=Piscinibacter sakaiensis TaxID=1547922 RepID=UPI003AB0689B